MNRTIHIRVPATSANCGPGFDSLGLALTLYNDFYYTIGDDFEGFHLQVEGEGEDQLKAGESNLAFASFLRVWNRYTGRQKIGIKVRMHNRIPLAHGLGSSSTAIVAGIEAANALLDTRLNPMQLLKIANDIEGHPDNVAPAILGGFTVSYEKDGKPYSLKVIPPRPLKFIAAVPEQPLATAVARKAIPATVPHADAVFNESRSALLVGALLTGQYEFLGSALEDRLHTPYRAKFIPGLSAVFKAAVEAGAYNCIISGAGSTLLAYADPNANLQIIAYAMKEAFNTAGQACVSHILDLDTMGTQVIES